MSRPDDPVRPAPPLGQPAPPGVDILTHQTKLAIKGVLRQTKHRRHLLASEVRGTAAGILYYLRHLHQPPYPGTDLEDPPQAKVAEHRCG